ncbi:prolipoprotein diacylglyceryl transferase [Colidextribacter sp. OB.20]|uniref:prolipoprotein diacylglyceryl transferase n=1 Tax=Colidextribacter sp. OB.20 TaxID=2304568 RepID=UPI00136E6F39|nr:prolipoprotein diacylglyceryl transferase [Colidextribacter sp. OB.20]NBI08559.1 prolipoprotein diacylglyceryl transferase [Colidextribacter sp. OB.20]
MINTISFPGLGLELTLNRVAFTIPVLDRPVYWYGVIITCGLILAVYLCTRWGKRFGISEDNIIDMMLFAVPAALVAVRVYYVVFNLDIYRRADGSLDWGAIVSYGDGGLAIYGAIISSAIILLIFCRVKRLSFLAYADLGVHGLFIGQLIGRWGNFMNVEAFGSATALPWRMSGNSIAADMLRWGYVDQAEYEAILSGALGVHPTFFYESAWNFVGLIMVYFMGRKRKFDGECFLFYFFWYGLGRTWIEGLRTDSLYLFGWELFGMPIRVSQLFAAITCVTAGAVLIWALWKYRNRGPELFVDRLAAQAARAEEDAKEG